jgi:alpha-tubulin suppressor-like RCC1 family protein
MRAVKAMRVVWRQDGRGWNREGPWRRWPAVVAVICALTLINAPAAAPSAVQEVAPIDAAAAVAEFDGSATDAVQTMPLAQPTSGAVVEVTPQASNLFTPIPPIRAIDTRFEGPLPAGWEGAATIGGAYGVPANAVAVELNVTATQPVGKGHLRVYPCGENPPNASTLNYAAGATVANNAVIALGASGGICVYTSTTTHVLVDITGYFPAGAVIIPRTPTRVADTRPGQPVGFPADKWPLWPGSTLQVPLGSTAGVPSDAAGVLLNVTATGTAGNGHLRVFPCRLPRPDVSTLNFTAGATVANGAIIAPDGGVCIYTSTTTHVIVDITGYLPANAPYSAVVPTRAVDSRSGLPLQAGSQTGVQIGGLSGLPANAAAAVLNITATEPVGPGHLRVFPCGQPLPGASTLNYPHGASVANGAIIAPGTGGDVCIYTSTTTHVLVDVVGFFPDSTTPPATATALATGASGEHTCVIVAGGQVKCWGYNEYGQLGDNTLVPIQRTPVTVVGLTGATALASARSHSCAIVAEGQVKCWGYNGSGQLGDGTLNHRRTPVTVTGLTGATALAAGNGHTCALVANGQVTCWGANGAGQLGDGTRINAPTPVSVTGLTGVTALVAGAGHTCALVLGGQVKCWGNNWYGQLGDGTSFEAWTPVTVVGLTDATALEAGASHTCAIAAGGQAKCWGYNDSGQLGADIAKWVQPTPVTVVRLSGATTLGAGEGHTCALVAGGQATCWGLNSSGQLGDSTLIHRRTPVSVTGLANATALAAGLQHTCALVAEGQVKCWGANHHGQLGDGTLIDRPTPVTVVGTG